MADSLFDGEQYVRSTDNAAPSGEESVGAKLSREASLIFHAGTVGVGEKIAEAAAHPDETMLKIAVAAGFSYGLDVLSRGAIGKSVSRVAIVGLAAASAKDVLPQVFNVANAVSDTWHSEVNLNANKKVVGSVIGGLVVDTGLFTLGTGLGTQTLPHLGSKLLPLLDELSAARPSTRLAFEGVAAEDYLMFSKRTKLPDIKPSSMPANDVAAVAKSSKGHIAEKAVAIEETLAAKRARVVDESVNAIEQFCRKHGAYDGPILTKPDVDQAMARFRQALSEPGGSHQWTPMLPAFKRITVSPPSSMRDIFGFNGNIAVVVANGSDTVDIKLTKELNKLIHRRSGKQWILDERL